MSLWKHLKLSLMIGGVVIVVRVLDSFQIDRFTLVFASVCFIITAIRNVGRDYLRVTNQHPLIRQTFDVTATPAMIFTWVLAIAYATFGEISPFYVVVAVVVALGNIAMTVISWFKTKPGTD